MVLGANAGAPELLRGVLEELLQRLRSGLDRGSALSGGWQVRFGSHAALSASLTSVLFCFIPGFITLQTSSVWGASDSAFGE